MSQMEPSNVASTKSFGVTAGKNRNIENSIPHPFPKEDSDGRLFFFPDVPHLSKNMVSRVIEYKKNIYS